MTGTVVDRYNWREQGQLWTGTTGVDRDNCGHGQLALTGTIVDRKNWRGQGQLLWTGTTGVDRDKFHTLNLRVTKHRLEMKQPGNFTEFMR
jgi:hypothetical protein